MKLGPFGRLRKTLRAPWLIITEVLAVAGMGALSTLAPQEHDEAAARAFAESSPRLAFWLHALALDRLLGSWAFLALLALAFASLLVTQVDQWRRVARFWGRPVDAARRMLSPPASGTGARASFHRAGRLGLLGSPLLHLGLLVLIGAGMASMAFSRQAVVDLFEGESLPADSSAWGAQWGGPLSEPYRLRAPLALEELLAETWPSGQLKALAAKVRFGSEPRALAINSPLELGADRLYLTAQFGPAAFLESRAGTAVDRRAVLLRPSAQAGEYEAATTLESGLEVRLVTVVPPGQGRPGPVEGRMLRDGGLLFFGTLVPGKETVLATGERLSLRGSGLWVRVRASHDPAVGLAYLGMALVLVGAAVHVLCVRVVEP